MLRAVPETVDPVLKSISRTLADVQDVSTVSPPTANVTVEICCVANYFLLTLQRACSVPDLYHPYLFPPKCLLQTFRVVRCICTTGELSMGHLVCFSSHLLKPLRFLLRESWALGHFRVIKEAVWVPTGAYLCKQTSSQELPLVL